MACRPTIEPSGELSTGRQRGNSRQQGAPEDVKVPTVGVALNKGQGPVEVIHRLGGGLRFKSSIKGIKTQPVYYVDKGSLKRPAGPIPACGDKENAD